MRLPGTLAAILLALGGCSSSSDAGDGGLPSAAATLAFTHLTNLLVVPVDVAGTTGLLGIDTGDPFVLLNPTTFPSAPEVGSVSTLVVESDHLTKVPVITSSDSPSSPDPSVPLGGLLGCTVICSSVVSFDYQNAVFTIGSSTPPSGLMTATSLPFAFKGGGTVQAGGMSVTVPRSRVVVSVEIEGAAHTMIVDTGASATVVDQAVYSALTSDGRTQLSGGMVNTTSGSTTASFTRVKTVSLGGAEVSGVLVSHDSSFDSNLADVSKDAGETIEGSLGGTFLDHFYLTIDYPGSELHLAPYTDTSFIYDLAENIGVSLAGANSDGYEVAMVFAGTDAASKGVEAGDVIVAVDGQMLASLTLSEATVLLGGKVGSTKMVEFGDAQVLANQTVSIAVSELLPLP
jgi:gag-polyprotein putative aspartyl protease/PDZ domain-containing protein